MNASVQRLGRGLYCYPRINKRLGITVPPDIGEIADAIEPARRFCKRCGIAARTRLTLRCAAASSRPCLPGAGPTLARCPRLRSIFEQVFQQGGVPAAQVGPAVDGLMAQVTQGFDIPLSTPPMPIQDAIDLADFLVQTAIGFTRFRAGSPTVGGPIEIAAITKHDGFTWVRHKEYYDRRLKCRL